MSKIKKRRSNGKGSIRQEPNGRWIGQIAIGFKEDGKADRRTKRADTKKEVIEWMAKLKHEILITGYKQRAETSRFDVLYRRWFNQHYAHAKNVYRKNLIERSNRLLDYFGDVEVQKITKELAQEYFNKELERCTRNTVKKSQNLLDSFFEFCQENNHIIKHPTKSIVLKGGNYARNQVKKRKALTDDEMARVDEVLENADLRDKVLITLLFHTGMRPSEVPAISWVDIQDGMLLITKAVKKQVEYEADGWTEKQAYSAVGLPKGSRDGEVKKRAIPISEKLETALVEWKEYQTEHPNPHNLISPQGMAIFMLIAVCVHYGREP